MAKSAVVGGVIGMFTGVAAGKVSVVAEKAMNTKLGKSVLDMSGNTVIDYIDDKAHYEFLPTDNDTKDRSSLYVGANSGNLAFSALAK